jgi:hypothetical protein
MFHWEINTVEEHIGDAVSKSLIHHKLQVFLVCRLCCIGGRTFLLTSPPVA